MTNTYAGKSRPKEVEITNWDENQCCEQNQINNVPQVIQREYNAVFQATGQDASLEAGRYTVPLGKMLIVELITLHVRDLFPEKHSFYIFATTSIGFDTVKHPIGTVLSEFGIYSDNSLATPIAGVMDSFQRTIYAEQGTDIIFTVVTKTGDAYPIDVTFSGRLIDVPQP